MVRGLAIFYAAQADLAENLDSGGGEFFEVVFDHAMFDHGSTGINFDSAGAKGVKGALRENRHRLQADNILRTAGRVDFAGGDHRGDAAVEVAIDPAKLILAGRPVAADGMDVAIYEAGSEGRTFR